MSTNFLETIQSDFNGVFYRSEIDFPLQFFLDSKPSISNSNNCSLISLEELFHNSILYPKRLNEDPDLLENTLKLNALYYVLKYACSTVTVTSKQCKEFSNTNIIYIKGDFCKDNTLVIKLETVYS